jgi:hypothetical protein
MRDRLRQRSALTTLAPVAGLLLFCASAAAATWLAPTSLSAAGENAATAQVAVDSHGDSVAVWDEGPDGSMNHLVQADVRPADGSWQSTPTNLATCFFFATTPQVAVDPKGDAIAAFECAAQPSGDRVIDVSTRPAGGSWSQPVTISKTAEINVEDPHVALDAAGDAIVTWLGFGSTTLFVEAAERPAGGTWSQPVDVSNTNENASAAPIAMDPDGGATAVWTSENGVGVVTEASERPKGATAWSPPVELSSADAGASNAHVVLTPQGASIAVWQHGSGTGATIQAAVRPAGGQWHAPVDISAPRSESPQLAIDSQGNATAVWDRSNGTNTVVQASQLPAGATAWQAPQNLSAAGQNATVPQVAAAAAGSLVAAWQRSNGTNTVVQAAAHPPGGAWQAPQDLSAAGQNAENPQVAVDPRGNATTVWDRLNGTNTIAQAAGYDAGPLLTAVTIPATGTVGKAVAFSASAAGVWSPVATTTWSFGDGKSATGPAVTHTYAAAGSYKVTVTVSDGRGGATATAQTITVAAPPAVPPTVSAVTETHKRWQEGHKLGHKHAPTGTSFSFTVSQPAQVTLAFTETAHGRKVKGKCVAATTHNAKHARCKRMLARGTLADTATAGRHTIHFDGRVSGHKLPVGAYTVKIAAANSAGKSGTAGLRFTIVR